MVEQSWPLGTIYNYRKVLGFISTEGSGSTEPGDTYSSRFPDIYLNVSVRPVVHTHLLDRYLKVFNSMENHNRPRQYDIALEKYWVAQSGYFRLATTVALVICTMDGKLLYCHGVVEENTDKKISTLDSNNRMVYDCLNNTFTYESFIPYLHLTPITIYYRTRPHKISQYTPNLPPAALSVSSDNSFSTFTTPSDSPDILPSDDPDTIYVMYKYVHFQGRFHRRYCCRKHGQNDT